MIKIEQVPHFRMTMSSDLLEALILCSKAHYDQECKNASKFGGILYGFKNQFALGAESITPLLTFRELDFLLKICEMVNDLEIVSKFKFAANQVLTWAQMQPSMTLQVSAYE